MPTSIGCAAGAAFAKRSIANGASGEAERPCVTSSAMISPTTGPSWKPCPEKPNAWIRFGVVADQPITGIRSGILPSMPVQLRITWAPASAGTIAIAFAIAASDEPVSGRERLESASPQPPPPPRIALPRAIWRR